MENLFTVWLTVNHTNCHKISLRMVGLASVGKIIFACICFRPTIQTVETNYTSFHAERTFAAIAILK